MVDDRFVQNSAHQMLPLGTGASNPLVSRPHVLVINKVRRRIWTMY